MPVLAPLARRRAMTLALVAAGPCVSRSNHWFPLNGSDGMPQFPIGYTSHDPVDADSTAPNAEFAAGFNQAMYYLSTAEPRDTAAEKRLDAFLDRCDAAGTSLWYDLSVLFGYTPSSTPQWDRISAEVKRVQHHRCIQAWYLSDEPDGNRVPAGRVRRGYELVKSIDSDRPIIICLCTVLPIASGGPLWQQYLNATDWVVADVYPVGNVDFPPASRNVQMVYDTIQAYQNYTPSQSGLLLPPVLVVPNAFGGGEVWPREPSAAEERAMVYLGIVAGADGLMFFTHDTASSALPNTCCYGSAPTHTSLWDACRTLAAELTELQLWLLARNSRQELETGSAVVRGAIWSVPLRSQSDTVCSLAIYVNTASTSSTAAVRLPDAQNNLTSVSVIFGPAPGWQLPVDHGVVHDTLEPLGVRLLRFWFHQAPPSVSVPSGHPSATPATIDSRNVLINPSFERSFQINTVFGSEMWHAGGAGSPDGFYAVAGGANGVDVAARWFVDSRDAVHGMQSLRLTSPRPDGGGVRLRAAPPGPVVANTSYELSCWARGSVTSGLSVRVVMGEGPHALLPEPGLRWNLSQTWSRYSVTVVPTVGQGPPPVYGDQVLLSYGLEGGPGTMWLDLLQFVPVDAY